MVNKVGAARRSFLVDEEGGRDGNKTWKREAYKSMKMQGSKKMAGYVQGRKKEGTESK